MVESKRMRIEDISRMRFCEKGERRIVESEGDENIQWIGQPQKERGSYLQTNLSIHSKLATIIIPFIFSNNDLSFHSFLFASKISNRNKQRYCYPCLCFIYIQIRWWLFLPWHGCHFLKIAPTFRDENNFKLQYRSIQKKNNLCQAISAIKKKLDIVFFSKHCAIDWKSDK